MYACSLANITCKGPYISILILIQHAAVPGNTQFSQFVPELKTVAIGGSVTLQCPCDGGSQQRWCVAGSTFGPLSFRFSLDGVSQVSTTQCHEFTYSSITISNIQQNMDGAMVYCARAGECNDPLGIVGNAKLLHTIGKQLITLDLLFEVILNTLLHCFSPLSCTCALGVYQLGS